ncbi:MAG: hypothetical protein ACRDYX_07255 [Egibacteraceae bacterium]
MPLVGAAIIPTAPLLVPGVSATLPDGVAEVRQTMGEALARLEHAEFVVLVAAGEDAAGERGASGPRGKTHGIRLRLHPTSRRCGALEDNQYTARPAPCEAGAVAPSVSTELSAWTTTGELGVYEHAEASLAGFGRPDLSTRLRVASWLSNASCQQGPLPPSLTVLALLVGDHAPVVPISVASCATAHFLAASGAAIATSLSGRGVLLAAGDLSAGLGERSPRYRVEGAPAWDEAVVAAVDAQRPERLAALGPAEARRVAALGWAPIVVAQAACMAAGLRLRVKHYSAPRGVGYLVAATDA